MTGIPEIGRKLKETLTEVTAEAPGKAGAGTEGAVPFKGGKKT